MPTTLELKVHKFNCNLVAALTSRRLHFIFTKPANLRMHQAALSSSSQSVSTLLFNFRSSWISILSWSIPGTERWLFCAIFVRIGSRNSLCLQHVLMSAQQGNSARIRPGIFLPSGPTSSPRSLSLNAEYESHSLEIPSMSVSLVSLFLLMAAASGALKQNGFGRECILNSQNWIPTQFQQTRMHIIFE